MRSRQYLIDLTYFQKTAAYIVYADRSVEMGRIVNGEFVRGHCAPCGDTGKCSRQLVAMLLTTARGYGNNPRREWL